MRATGFPLAREAFSSGHIVDVILLIIVAEYGFLLWRSAPAARGAVALELFFRLAPGACLLLALRAALTGASWMWVGVWLAASFPLHIADLARRRR